IPDAYSFKMVSTPSLVIDWESAIHELLADVARGVKPGIISARFHNALVEMIVAVAQRIGQTKIVLTGGCFQNRCLIEHAVERLREEGFCSYWHQRIPPNDGGIALGQCVAASWMRFDRDHLMPTVES